MLDIFEKADFTKWERFYRAAFFNSLGGYKSLNLLASQNKSGQTNLGLFFSVAHIGANEALLSLTFRPHTVARHSLENLREGYATLNAVHGDMLAQAHQTSANFSRDESEFDATGLSTEYRDFPAPFVKESRIRLGIKYCEEHHIKANDTILVVASIEKVILDHNFILKDGLVDHSLAGSLAVNGLDAYYEASRFKRYAYARSGVDLEEKSW
jgi:flavin reductase (DIM6/NTAB) family NADH-FMN oxidoreductase RutF